MIRCDTWEELIRRLETEFRRAPKQNSTFAKGIERERHDFVIREQDKQFIARMWETDGAQVRTLMVMRGIEVFVSNKLIGRRGAYKFCVRFVNGHGTQDTFYVNNRVADLVILQYALARNV